MLVKHKGTEQYFAMKILDKQKVSESARQPSHTKKKQNHISDPFTLFDTIL